jgi:hypothetical protein
VSPKANETPSKPTPIWGKEAAMTAVPQPPKVSQNVPISSAAHFFAISLLMRKSLRGARDPSRSSRASLSLALINVRSKLEFKLALTPFS